MNTQTNKTRMHYRDVWILLGMALLLVGANAFGFTLHVVDADGNEVNGFRWMVEVDTTFHVLPGVELTDTLGTITHNSYAPVETSGYSVGSSTVVAVPDDKRYLVTVIPYAGYSISGQNVAVGQDDVTVTVNPQPLPTAQISVLVFHDNFSINNAPDAAEEGLANFEVVVSDAAGQQMLDAFGNMLGTTYQRDTNTGQYILDDSGAPIVDQMGDGTLLTDVNGELTVKNLAAGKYGIVIVPPPDEIGWIQTSTVEGTPTVDAWVKPNEPSVFVELGPASYHVFYGFIKQFQNFRDFPGPKGTITGRVVFNHFDRPPNVQGFFAGSPVEGAWVGLNNPDSGEGLYAAPCGDGGVFTIEDVPPGTYELVTWDENLDAIFGFNQVSVPGGGQTVDLGDVLSFRWFGTLEGSVFYDADEDGFRDPGEMGIGRQAVNIRYRNGTIYQVTQTDPTGDYAFEEVFPFFKWLVVEVDYARHKATGMTSIVDYGGTIPPDNGWDMPSRNKLNPQPQVDENGVPIINPNTGNNLSRTETGPVLLQAMHLFLGQTNIIDWGKKAYDLGSGENGGISGILYYAVTRAEDDPRFAAAEDWEPGIPNAQVNLYFDINSDGVIDDFNNDGPTLADVDNWPFGWMDNPAMKGPEDVDRNSNGTFDPGDAIQIVRTDSWDDNKPTGSIQDPLFIHGGYTQTGFDNYATWNQIRDGVFDGGYAFNSFYPDGIASGNPEMEGLPNQTYIVEAATPPGYELVKEEDKNVDFGDEWTPSTLLQPPACVGDPHLVPQYMSFQTDESGVPLPGIDPADLVETAFGGQMRPMADRKQLLLSPGKNAAADFYFFTQVPKGALAIGFINNDLTAEFKANSPINGEKGAPSWLPISFQDWAGHELARVYCDEFGTYNALLPSSFTNSMPAPAGFLPQMLTFVINHPGPIPDPENPGHMIVDPYYNPDYSQSPFTFNFQSGTITYLDTPVFPVAAFVGYPDRQLDIEPATGTPVIYSVEGPDGGPIVCDSGSLVTIKSVGSKIVPNPEYVPDDPNYPELIVRDFGFGTDTGVVTVGGQPATVQSWTDAQITIIVNFTEISTGTVQVTRQDTGQSSELGVTLHINECDRQVIHVSGGANYPYTPIQNAIDSADDDALIIIEPGDYWENPIVYKPVTLQGSGAESTRFYAMSVPSEKVALWDGKIAELLTEGDIPDVGLATGQLPGITVIANPDRFTDTIPAMIDGIQVTGASAGGGIHLAANAHYTLLKNNKVLSNQGTPGGGIIIGLAEQGASVNTHIRVENNYVLKNGGITGGGGITIYGGSDSYRIVDNLIMGNFTQFSGAGISHTGISDDALILRNRILFNEVFYGGQIGGDGGGIYVASQINPEDPGELSNGAGNVSIVGNLLQGNLAGSGFGGGICADAFNGAETAGNAENWYKLEILNNIIVNNVAANAAGGIYLHDVANGYIVNNTVAHNDSTATAANTFTAGMLLMSNPQPAGIVSSPHSQNLADLTAQTYSSPLLANNIIQSNHSYYWDASLNDGSGGLTANTNDPIWDLAVIGFPMTPYLSPQYCLLTGFTDSSGADYNNGNNVIGNALFISAYDNTIKTAAVIDEAGNFITTRFEEIALAGDYHIAAGSDAVNLGIGAYMADHLQLYKDFDGQWRPLGGIPVDSGADERVTVTTPADMNADCIVNALDIIIFIDGWLNNCDIDIPCPGNFNADSAVNGPDFAYFASQWLLNTCP